MAGKKKAAKLEAETAPKKDDRKRKFLLTINNPGKLGLTHEVIKDRLSDMKSLLYWCMADERGNKEKTHHTHLYVQFSNQVRFSTMQKAFHGAHFERFVFGTAQQNRDYIAKEGKWENDEKHGTKIDGTFEEWGELPEERQGKRNDMVRLMEMIEDGKTDCQIFRENPSYMRNDTMIDRVRQKLRFEKYRTEFRKMKVYYIHGATGVGKTRYVMEGQCGIDKVCPADIYRVTNYKHPFDSYEGQPVIAFDEYRSHFAMSDILNYLDGYAVKLPARYGDKQACYSTVYIISNEPLRDQYRNIQQEHPETWAAFLRRITDLLCFTQDADGKLRIEFEDIGEHMTGAKAKGWDKPAKHDSPGFVEIDSQEELPF